MIAIGYTTALTPARDEFIFRRDFVRSPRGSAKGRSRIMRERVAANPNGILSQSPGLRAASYPGSGPVRRLNPNGVAASFPQWAATPLGLKFSSSQFPKVARASQPWAGGHNPFGIREGSPRLVYNHKRNDEGEPSPQTVQSSSRPLLSLFALFRVFSGSTILNP